MISLEQGVDLVWRAFAEIAGGEIYVRKIPSMNIVDIAEAVCKKSKKEIIGVRPGEKIHEQMIGIEDAPYTYEYDNYFKIVPSNFDWYDTNKHCNKNYLVPHDFTYTSDNNKIWMTKEQLSKWINTNKDKFLYL